MKKVLNPGSVVYQLCYPSLSFFFFLFCVVLGIEPRASSCHGFLVSWVGKIFYQDKQVGEARGFLGH
jgi:hypothetical protein